MHDLISMLFVAAGVTMGVYEITGSVMGGAYLAGAVLNFANLFGGGRP